MRWSSPRRSHAGAVGRTAAEHEPPAAEALQFRARTVAPTSLRSGPSSLLRGAPRSPTSSDRRLTILLARWQAEHRPHGRQAGQGAGLVDVVAHRRGPLDAGRSPAGRRAGAARPARTPRTCAAAAATTASNGVGRQRRRPSASTAERSWASCSRTVPLPARKPSTNAAPAAAGVPGVSARAEPCLDGRRRPPAAVVEQPGRPALDEPVHAAVLGELLEHAPGTRRGAPGGRRRPAPPGRRSSARSSQRAASSSSCSAARPRPATTRSTSSSNTIRSAGRVGAADVAVAQRAGQRARARPSARRRRACAAASSPSDARRAGCSASGRSASRARSTAAATSARRVEPRRLLGQPRRRRRLDGRAVTGQLDDADRQLGLPRQPPRLAERAARRRGPPPARPRARRARSRRCSRCERRSPFGVPQVELDDLDVGRRLQAGGPLARGEVAGQRHLRRVGRDLADGVADDELVDRRAAGPPSTDSAASRTSARPAAGVGAATASESASRDAAIRWSGDAGMPVAAQRVGGVDEEPGDALRAGVPEDVVVPARAEHARAVARRRGAGGGASTAPTSRRP